ncbi:MAG: carboxypeptidase regulatory-like domain-containing protein [Terriglobales bacterium]
MTGSITGYVRDKSGAVIPNASVTAIQTATSYSRTVASDAAGQYSFLALPPGRYRLTASVASFQQGVVDNIDLNVNDALHFDFVLQVGSVNESVSVDANAVQVQTVATSTGTTIESPQILAMPLNGRSYLDLLSLQAGVSPANTNSSYSDRGPASGLYTSTGNVSTDGQPEYANAFLVNGAEVNETKNMGAGLIPNADSIGEFRLLTNSFSAEYGKFSGAVMNTVTKSGTNRFHGTLFEFYRNQGLDAVNYFDTTKAELKQHQYGGVFGGPIWKDKLFFFTDYQQTRRVAGASTGVVQVMSDDERNGIFPDSALTGVVQGDDWAATLMSRGGGSITAGVTTYNQLGTAVTTTALDSNGNVISVPGHNISAYIDPVTALTLSQIPQANLAGGFNYSDSSHAASLTDTNMGQRIDFVNHMTGDWSFYYHYDDATAVQPIYTQSYQGVNNLPGYPVTVPSRNQLFTMSNTKTFGSTAVNVVRLQFFRTAVRTSQPSAASTISGYDVYGFNTDPANGGLINTGTPGYPSSLPMLLFNNFAVGNNWLNFYQPDSTYGIGDSFSKTVGNHSLSFGGDFRYYQLNARNECGPNGYFQFSGNETGTDVSDYFVGAPGGFVQCSVQLLDNRTRYFGLFGQDSWKARPNLTVNLGLRWDVARPWSDVFGRLTTPVPGLQSTKFPDSPRGNVVPGDPGVPSTISPTRYNNFAPRIGIAWAPSGGIWGENKTSIRAAYGIYYLGAADNGNFGILGDAPWGLYWASPQPTQFASPYITRANGVSQGQHFPFVFPSGSGPFPNFKFGSLMPLYLPGYYYKNKTQMAEHYNISIQRQLDKSTVLTVAYVGTQGHHIQSGHDILWGDSALCQSLAGCGPGGEGGVYTQGGQNYYGTLTGLINNQVISQGYTNSAGGPVVAFASATYLQNAGNSNYNSLQVSAERRARDVTFLLSYTYSHSLDNVSAKWDPRDPSRAYGPSTFDLRHNLVMSYNWDLPFDRLFGPRRITTGWHITGISRFNSGTPVSVKSGGDYALTNIGLDYPNQIGSINKMNPRDSANKQYFNTSAFATGLSCGYEVCGVTGSAGQYLFNGPGAINTDLGVEKDTKITESMALNFRFEMFNVFNHANFTSVVGNANSSQFGQVTNTAPARIGQISGKFVF